MVDRYQCIAPAFRRTPSFANFVLQAFASFVLLCMHVARPQGASQYLMHSHPPHASRPWFVMAPCVALRVCVGNLAVPLQPSVVDEELRIEDYARAASDVERSGLGVTRAALSLRLLAIVAGRRRAAAPCPSPSPCLLSSCQPMVGTEHRIRARSRPSAQLRMRHISSCPPPPSCRCVWVRRVAVEDVDCGHRRPDLHCRETARFGQLI